MANVKIEKYDDYPTPLPDARYLTSLLPIEPGSTILEPHANKGNFLRAIKLETRGMGCKYFANEYQAKYIPTLRRVIRPKRVRHGDFFDIKPRSDGRFRFDWAIGNPPFTGNSGILHTEHALKLARNVAFFLPLRYLSSGQRFQFWNESPIRRFWSVAERPVFVGSSGGRTDYAFYHWQHGYEEEPTFGVISLL